MFAFGEEWWNILRAKFKAKYLQQEFGYSVLAGADGLICAIGGR
jgi:hypothetical protein